MSASTRSDGDDVGPVDALRGRLQQLFVAVRRPTYRGLQAHADLVGRALRTSTIGDLLNGSATPRWDTVEKFVVACARHAHAHRIPVPAAMLDLKCWHAWYREMEDAVGGRVDAERTADGAVSRRRTRRSHTPAQLPPDTLVFTGREGELDRVVSAVGAAAVAGSVVAIHAIDGMPGVGKTTLAVHAAHRLADRFPDGQLFVDLHAHTPGREASAPAAVLAALLNADGLDARHLPDTVEARSALWRERLAGRRILLVLDNAAGSDQVEPLLPAHEGCLVLVTSRRHLGDLPGRVEVVALDVLPPDHAEGMFRRLAPRAATDLAGPVAELMRLAGYLPLAIGLLGKVYTRHPTWSLAELLAETRTRLLDVSAENATVAAAFHLSYQQLPEDRQRLFRRLGLHPGTEIERYAAAALAGISVTEATDHLDALHGDNLLTEVGYRRYIMHDLIRQYARTLAAAEPTVDRQAAVDRLCDYYQSCAGATDAHLARYTRSNFVPAPADPTLNDPGLALAWARVERGNLLACLANTDDPRRVVALTAGVAELLRIDGPWDVATDLHVRAVRAAEQVGDRRGQANALFVLAQLRRRSVDIGQANQDLRRALDLFGDLEDQRGRANVLVELGVNTYGTGDAHESVPILQEALDLHCHLGDQLGRATAANYLGIAWYHTGQYPAAVQALRQALEICDDLDDRLGQAMALLALGITLYRMGDDVEAASTLERGRDLSQDLGDRLSEATALTILGTLRYRAGDHTGAIRSIRQALNLSRSLGDRLIHAMALTHLGGVLRRTGDHAGAATALHGALEIYRDLGFRSGEATALNESGALHRASGDLGEAVEQHRRARELARQAGTAWDEAHALAGLARCAHVAGRADEAADGLRAALAIFRRIGAAEADEIATELDALD